MKCAAARSTAEDSITAAKEVVEGVLAELGGRPDLAFLFVSPHHADALDTVVSTILGALEPRNLLGAMAESIVANEVELEHTHACALWAVSAPGMRVETSHVEFDEAPDGGFFAGTPAIDPTEDLTDAALLLLVDPFSFPADAYLRRCEEDFPGLGIIGGVASGGRGPGASRLIRDGEILSSGAITALVRGGNVRPLVSQGCRPFGRSFVITKAERNVILGLKGKPAAELLLDQISRLAPEERQLLHHGLHIGISVDPSKEKHERGDFLVRNVMGIDQDNGAIAVADLVRAGQTIQFHVRDAGTASEDLHVLLRRERDSRAGEAGPCGGLLFTCNGRGRRLFQAQSHDAGAIAKELDSMPIAGFFAAGEIGPIGGRNFLHGFTASLVLFGP